VGGLEVLEHVGGGDAQGRITGDAGGVGDGLGDPGLAQARLADAQDVALLLDEAAVAEFLDDAHARPGLLPSLRLSEPLGFVPGEV